MPWSRFGKAAIAHRPNQIDQGNQQTDSEYRRACRRKHVQHLPRNQIRRISMIAAWHAHITEHELRREGQIKSDENYKGGKTSPTFRIHPATDLGPPIMQAAKIGQQRPADHDVVKMRDDEISVAEMNVRRQR